MEYMGFVNLTPFAADQFMLMDKKGVDVLTFVVKGTYAIKNGVDIEIAEEQVPINTDGEDYGEPGLTSLKYDSEVAFSKVTTDVVLIGHAYAPKRNAKQVDVSLRAGHLSKRVRVFGDRFWKKTLGFWSMTVPRPFEKMPLQYELAFGGWDRSNENPAKQCFEARNPVGTGYISKKHGKMMQGTKLPNIEDPRFLIKSPKDQPPPAGFGFIAPNWQPRVRFAGTYDENWEKNRMPLLPPDFDSKFFNSGHPDLISSVFFQGGERIEITNVSLNSRIQFALPTLRPEAVVMMKDETRNQIDMNIDTVIINTDENLLFLIWRGTMPIHKKVHKILWAKTQVKKDATV